MFDEIIPMTGLKNIVSGINPEKNSVHNVWKSVVSKIRTNKDSENCETKMPIGERLAGNTRVIDLKNGILLIETDHAGWIQYLKIYEKFILKGLKMSLPDLKINSLAFRLSGSEVKFSESYESSLKKAQDNYKLKLENQEKILNKINENKNQNTSNKLPKEFLDHFESIRKSIEERE